MPTAEVAPGRWAVLALVDEGITHGFAIARALGPDGEVGRIWTVKRALVYRTLDLLAADGLVAAAGPAPSARGPRRELVEITPAGSAAVAAWLQEPVEHVRETRSSLLLKLFFLHRRDADASELIRAQRVRFEHLLDAMDRRVADASGFDRTALLWRRESTLAAVRFLEGVA